MLAVFGVDGDVAVGVIIIGESISDGRLWYKKLNLKFGIWTAGPVT